MAIPNPPVLPCSSCSSRLSPLNPSELPEERDTQPRSTWLGTRVRDDCYRFVGGVARAEEVMSERYNPPPT
jgi:hypothetical protein